MVVVQFLKFAPQPSHLNRREIVRQGIGRSPECQRPNLTSLTDERIIRIVNDGFDSEKIIQH
jgi:hypothetical protein